MNAEEHHRQLADALAQVKMPSGITIHPWSEADFPAIERLSGTTPLGGGQFRHLSHSLDSAVDSPYPSF